MDDKGNEFEKVMDDQKLCMQNMLADGIVLFSIQILL